MNKIYKFNENQLKLIVESQKNSPQLQTEILDNTANAFTQLLTWGFKQSMNAFRYISGIGVNVFYFDRFTPTGKYPIKKQNPLAPLSLYDSNLVGFPSNYQDLFKSVYQGLPKEKKDIENPDTNPNEDLTNIVDNLSFDDVKGISYPIKFKFENLKREAKENSELMMTTWALVFNVDSTGTITSDNTMIWTLSNFSSQGPSISRFIEKSKQSDNKNEFGEFLQNLSKVSDSPSNELSLIFSNQSQAQKFKKLMAKQIQLNMKLMIGQLNAKMGVKNVIKAPKIIVEVDPKLIGDYNLQKQNQNTPLSELEDDINEIKRQINIYQKENPNYVKDLKSILIRLELKIKDKK